MKYFQIEIIMVHLTLHYYIATKPLLVEMIVAWEL